MPQKQDCKTTYSTINMTQEEAKSWIAWILTCSLETFIKSLSLEIRNYKNSFYIKEVN